MIKEGKASNALNSFIPHEIIHHILSYLNPKQKFEAALLSKNWLAAWRCCPVLEFDDRYFANLDQLKQHANWALTGDQEEDEARNCNGQEICFKLNLASTYDYSFVGPFRCLFQLAVRKNAKSVRLLVSGGLSYSVLPENFLQLAEFLTDLQFRYCDLQFCETEVCCTNLRSLHLHPAYIDDETLNRFISSCPSLKRLRVSSYGGKTMEIDAPNAVHMEFQYLNSTVRSLELHGSENLQDLYLRDFNIPDVVALLDKFPNLKFLEVKSCYGDEFIQFLYTKLVADRRRTREAAGKFWAHERVEIVIYNSREEELSLRVPIEWSSLKEVASFFCFKLEWDVYR